MTDVKTVLRQIDQIIDERKAKIQETIEACGGADVFLSLIEAMVCTNEIKCDLGWTIYWEDRSRYNNPPRSVGE